MNENLDLTKILEGCPRGTKFYSSVYGKVDFSRIISDDNGEYYPIELMAYNKYVQSIVAVYCEKDGTFSCGYEGECTLFPSEDQRDWSKFERFWDKPKKVERFDVHTLQPFDRVLVRDNQISPWFCDFFSHFYKGENRYNVGCIGNAWNMCIPYNEETKHLLGTKDDCPEYYKWWEE